MVTNKVVRLDAILVIFTTTYLLTVWFTDLSLIGYWTDLISSVFLVSTTLLLVFKHKFEEIWVTTTLRTVAVLCSVAVYGFIGLKLINSVVRDTFKTKSFCFQQVEGRLFNAYFRPVGAYAGGEGSFWITESPQYFPLIEVEKFYDGSVLWDFNATVWEGEPVDQKRVVKAYVIDKILTDN